MSEAVKLEGEVSAFNHIRAIAVIGSAVNCNADVLDKLIKRVNELEKEIKKIEQEAEAIDGSHCGLIRTAPTIEAIPTAEWIIKAEDYYKAVNERGGGVDENTPYFDDDIACPKCLTKFSVIDNETERFKCCPNCGARMEAGNEQV